MQKVAQAKKLAQTLATWATFRKVLLHQNLKLSLFPRSENGTKKSRQELTQELKNRGNQLRK